MVKGGSAHPVEDVSDEGGCRGGVEIVPIEIGLRQSGGGKRDEIDGGEGGGQFGAGAGFEDGIGGCGDDDGETAAFGTGTGGEAGMGGKQRVKRTGGDGDGDSISAPLVQTLVEF